MATDEGIESIYSNLKETVTRYHEKNTEIFTVVDAALARMHLETFQHSAAGRAISAMLGRENPFSVMNVNSDIKCQVGDKGTVRILDQHIDRDSSQRQLTLYGLNHPPGIHGSFSSLDGKTGTSCEGLLTENMAFGIIRGNFDVRSPFQLEIKK